MNKVSRISYFVLIIAIGFSLTFTVISAKNYYQQTQLNKFIANVSTREDTPDAPQGQLARAYDLTQRGENQKALDILSHFTSSDDLTIRLPALLNRANINLREAMLLRIESKQRIPLAELAKQDYRTALLLNPEQWDVRYNLELALTLVPELPEDNTIFDKPSVLRQRTVESKGFKVDLP